MQRACPGEDLFLHPRLDVLDDLDALHQEACFIWALPELGAEARCAAGGARAEQDSLQHKDLSPAQRQLHGRAAAGRSSSDDDDVRFLAHETGHALVLECRKN